MTNEVPIKIKLKPMSANVYELRTVVHGIQYKRLYVGYNKQNAIKMFQKWLGGKI